MLLTSWATPMGDKGVRVTVRLRSNGAPFRQPDLFIEGLRRGWAGPPEAAITDDGRALDLVVQISGTTALTVATTPLTFTFTDGTERAAEFVSTPALRTNAGVD